MAIGVEPEVRKSAEKSAAAFRTISEVGRELDIPQHVLRFWESKFSQVKPLKRGGGRRYYRPEDIQLLRRIRDLLYTEGYTIRGVQRLFREVGVKSVLDGAGKVQEGDVETQDAQQPHSADESAVPVALRAELEAVMAELVALRRMIDTE
ncbi:MAG: MerR family transcriptional regulator [Alphaproteobacteria bacterium]|nr:MerR family transcriptional regulator [Alphaproteobacteria bacterium]